MSKRNLTELTCEQCKKVIIHDKAAMYGGGIAEIRTWLDLRNYQGTSRHFCSAICLADALKERLAFVKLREENG